MAFIQTWDETFPSDTQLASMGADDIRRLTYAVRERLAVDHYNLAVEAGDAKIGFHKKTSYVDQVADLLGALGATILYGKTIGGIIELFLVLSDNTVIQLTRNGKLNASSIDGVIPVANLGTGTPTAAKVLHGDGTWGTDATVEPATLADVLAGIITDKYVSPATMIGFSGTTKGWINMNGLGAISIRDSYNVSGISDNGTGDYTVTWAIPFAAANYSVVGSVGGDSLSFGIFINSLLAGSVRFSTSNWQTAVRDYETICLQAIGAR